MAETDFLASLRTDLTAIIIVNTEERRKVHQYLDTKDVYQIGATCKLYNTEEKYFFYNCPDRGCGNLIKVTRDMYHRGYMENNRDEYYSIACDKCDLLFSFEPNYDDYTYKGVRRNNMILVGPCVKPCVVSRPEKRIAGIVRADISEEEFTRIIEKASVFKFPIPKPTLRINVGSLQNYVTDLIKQIKK